MDPSALVVIVIVAIAAFGGFWALSQSQKRQAAWRTLADQLGLQQAGDTLHGDYEGLPVRIAMETRQAWRGYTQFCVVRVEVPGELPPGFVAAPRSWTSGLDRVLADNLLSVTDSALKECYVFQSDQPQKGQVLIDEPEVQRALLELYSPLRVGFVEKNRVNVAYKSWLISAEEARGALKDVVHAAQTLAAAHARLGPSSTPLPTS
ncbi:MAG TPA: hypothetical protein VNA24_26130 [Hyalangium sp.]|nr:hypothetical protein [Hyalangium sp.]